MARRPALPCATRRTGSAASLATALASAPASAGVTRNPVTPSATRSSGPPAAGATTGTPLAAASCKVLPNVSCGPLCTNTSRLAYACASCSPPSWPRNKAPGSARRAAGSDDHQAHAGQSRHVGEQVQALLRGEPADVPDDHLAAGGQTGAPGSGSLGRAEPSGVHAAPPDVYPGEALGPQIGGGACRRRERPPRRVVQAPQMPPRGRFTQSAEVVGAGVGGHVGGIHGHHRKS